MADLIYTMGPSGAGKDSLLAWLKTHIPGDGRVHFAQRCIDRPCKPGDESHEALSTEAFVALQKHRAFGMCWQANGRLYGIKHAELTGPEGTRWVIVNGSRGYLSTAIEVYPHLHILHITASPDVLAQRLSSRGRETVEEIRSRLQRNTTLLHRTDRHVMEVSNDGSLEESGRQTLSALGRLRGWDPAIASRT